jgi:parvulin-like peptidyl-prolyl isomerase
MTQCRSTIRMGRKRLGILLASLFLVALCATIRYYWGAQPANAAAADDDAPARGIGPASVANGRGQGAAAARSPSAASRVSSPDGNGSDSATPAVVATVNTQRITRDDLARQCRRRHGQEVLESMVNRHLIVAECQRQGVSVTRAEVDAEIARMAKRFGIPVDQWLKMLKQERNITPEQYANDIIWTTLALRRLAGQRLAISREELIQEFETEYGEMVRARLIAVTDPQKAKKLQAQAAANPEEFGNLAKDYSEDAPSASAKGLINPIRKHGSYKEIEDAVFNMADGEVSPVIEAGGQFVILKREKLLPAQKVNFEQVEPRLEEVLRDRKMRPVAQELFPKLQKEAKVENVWNDPAKRERLPGVAATINGQPIAIRELDAECIGRHGQEVLEGMISRKIIEQACQKQNITVTENDLDAEIALAASVGVKPKADGSPNVEAWLDLVSKKHGISLDIYRSEMVWPMAALKKLVGDKVEVSDDDLRKGYEANYGPRVRCLAIVLDNQRRATQVFEMARKNNTTEYFGELATQYSVEPGSQAMHGEVPPIRKNGGQPKLEEEAFALRPGELSGVIQVGDKFVILRCEEYTKPAAVPFASVRNDIYEDLHEKKLQVAMGDRFENLQEAATVDNYLAGTSHSPKARGGASPAVKVPSLRAVPGG